MTKAKEKASNGKPKKLTCKQCNFTWLSRPGRLALSDRTLPARCPKCISRNWQKPKAKAAGKKKAATSAPKKKATSVRPKKKKQPNTSAPEE